jgi:hypothetical protein
MTLALQSPELVDNIISVDNAPVDAALLNDFAKYIQGMRKIEESDVSRQTEADKILQEYEEASIELPLLRYRLPLISSVSPHPTVSPRQPLPSGE